MTTTTTETLSIDGLVLNTLGYNIDLWSGTVGSHTRQVRHQVVPRRAGAINRTPQVLATPMMLSMWVSDRNVNGIAGGRQQMWTNLDTILVVLGQTGDLIALQKKRESSGGLITLNAEAEVLGPIEWTQTADNLIQLTVPMVMPFPYWKGASEDQTVTGASGSFTNDGHASAEDITITLEAGGSNWVSPVVENVTTGVTLTYDGTVDANDVSTINLWDGTATNDAGASVSGIVTVNGNFFPLAPGSNSINVTQSSGSGTVRCVFNPPYLG